MVSALLASTTFESIFLPVRFKYMARAYFANKLAIKIIIVAKLYSTGYCSMMPSMDSIMMWMPVAIIISEITIVVIRSILRRC